MAKNWKFSTLFCALLGGVVLFTAPARAFTGEGCSVDPSPEYPPRAQIADYNRELANPNSIPAEAAACAYFGRGLLYHFLGDYPRAIADYSAAIELEGDFGDAQEARGDAYAESGHPEKAQADYLAVTLLQFDLLAHHNSRCWDRAMRGHPLDRALADCSQEISDEPKQWEGWDDRCLVYYRLGNDKAAISDCTEALKLKPGNDSSLYIRGLSRLRAGDASGGNADIAAAKSANPRVVARYAMFGVTALGQPALNANVPATAAVTNDANDNFALCTKGSGQAQFNACTSLIQSGNRDKFTGFEAFFHRGMIYVKLRRYDDAIKDLDSAADLNPDSAELFNNRGLLDRLMHNYPLAIAHFNRSIALNPKDISVYINRGDAYDALAQYAQAIADYDVVIAAQPSAQAFNSRCWSRAKWGQQLEMALADCGAALKLQPGNPSVLDTRALVYFRLRDYAAAIADSTAALKANPKLASSLYVRGLSEMKTHRGPEGAKDTAAAKKLDPKIAEAYAVYGVKQ